MEGETPRIKVGFRKGESIRVSDGPFIDLIGIVDEIYADKGTVRVLISLFGRETPVELDFLQIERL
jgi:transcriptional antiterminator NusG